MADRAQEILDGCSHIRCEVCGGSGKVCPSCDTHDSGEDHDCNLTERACRVCEGSGRKWPLAPCRPCALRAVEAATDEEREACAKAIAKAKNEAPDRSEASRVAWICAANYIAATIRARGAKPGAKRTLADHLPAQSAELRAKIERMLEGTPPDGQDIGAAWVRANLSALLSLVPVAHDDQQGGKPVEVDRG